MTWPDILSAALDATQGVAWLLAGYMSSVVLLTKAGGPKW